MASERLLQLFDIVNQIPAGRVASYGTVGRALASPVSGLLVGRWLNRVPDDVAWWRVVGRDGSLLLAKRGPEFAAEQRRRLEAEGVLFEGDRVATSAMLSLLDY